MLLVAVCVLGCGALGLWMIMTATHRGPGLSPDSRGYAQAARSIRSRQELLHFNGDLTLVPQTHFAPLFSVVLGRMMRVGIPFEQGARWLNALLFVLNCGLFALMLARCVDRQWALAGALLGGVLAGFSPVLVHVHTMVWSEPLFFTFMLGTFLLVGIYIDGGNRAWLLGGAVAAALAFLTRYAGASVVMAVFAALLERGPSARTRKRRLLDAILFFVTACAPMVGWFARNVAVSGSAANRTVAFQLPDRSDLKSAVTTLADWALPTSERPEWFAGWSWFPGVGAALVSLLAVAVFIAMLRYRKTLSAGRRSGTIHLLLWFAPLYSAFLLVSMTWLDAATELDFRILSPLYIGVMVLAAAAAFALVPAVERRWGRTMRRVVVTLLVLVVTLQSGRTLLWSLAMRWHGIGYYSHPWRHSELLAFARRLPGDTLIYTNAPDAVYLRAGRLAKPIPRILRPGSLTQSRPYRKMLAQMHRDMEENDGVLLFFRSVSRAYLVSERRIQQELHLQLIRTVKDGAAYRVAPAGSRRAGTRPAAPPTTARNLEPGDPRPAGTRLTSPDR